jgi:hypothetical protein
MFLCARHLWQVTEISAYLDPVFLAMGLVSFLAKLGLFSVFLAVFDLSYLEAWEFIGLLTESFDGTETGGSFFCKVVRGY